MVDVIRDTQNALAVFQGGGTTFHTKGAKPAGGSLQIGAGFSVHTLQATVLSMNYDLVLQEDFVSHAGFIKYRYEW